MLLSVCEALYSAQTPLFSLILFVLSAAVHTVGHCVLTSAVGMCGIALVWIASHLARRFLPGHLGWQSINTPYPLRQGCQTPVP
uniref:Uncharacterized protein n=1 Tax=Anguilla anguilla TaxID=7936 RepID=A0A0E9PWJ5_ANGAN